MKKLILLILINLIQNAPSFSQEFYYWGDWYGFGIADFSNCAILNKFDKPPANSGATINVFKCPNGLFYRASEIDGGFLNNTEPYYQIINKQHQFSDVNRINERAVAACINSKSLIYIVMRSWDNYSKSYLMEYDYKSGRFTILGNVSKGLRSIVALGNKFIGIEEKLQPYRHYNIVQLNVLDPINPKILFQIDSSLWVKDYNPQITSPNFQLFKNYQSCDKAELILSCYTRFDSITNFYKLDFINQKCTQICSMDIRVYISRFIGEGIKGFDFLKDCRFEIDFDLNNSSDTSKNYRTDYFCPQQEQKLHDQDWNYYSDGPLDSLRVEIASGGVDDPNEYLKANYIPQGIILIGNKSQSLLFTSNSKIVSSEIQKILDGIVYKNELSSPSPGQRIIRTCIYVPWFEDTVYTRISIPVFENQLSDTSIWLCPDGDAYSIYKLIPSLANFNGHWLNPDLNSGVIYAGLTISGIHSYLYTRGINCIPDTMILRLNYFPNPAISLGPDQITEGNLVQQINLSGDFSNVNTINWFLNGNWVADQSRTFSFEFNQDTLVSVSVLTNDQCQFYDSTQYFIKISDDDIWIPDAFSPNGDNINDQFGIAGKYNLYIYNFEIFDRWGNQYFTAGNFRIQDKSQSWNGTVINRNANPGPYIYRIEYAGTAGRKLTKSGIINLIR